MTNCQHENVSKAITDGLFRDMQNPEFRGSSFTWGRFPNMAKNMVEANLFLYYKRLPANFEAIKVKAGQHALDYAIDLVAKNQVSLTADSKKSSSDS